MSKNALRIDDELPRPYQIARTYKWIETKQNNVLYNFKHQSEIVCIVYIVENFLRHKNVRYQFFFSSLFLCARVYFNCVRI